MVGESVGGCGARAVSRKTPIYFIFYTVTPRFVGICIVGLWVVFKTVSPRPKDK